MALPVTQSQAANGVPLARRPVTLGVIVGNRGFFPNHLAITGRKVMLDVLADAGIKTIIVGEDETACGAITSMREVQICVDLFRQHRDDIDGILITLPNFGEETAMADVLKRANLNVPVFIHAFPDDVSRMGIDDRRDSFCGKMSICNNLRQYNIPYSLTRLHTVDPTSESFMYDLKQFAAVCRVVRGMRTARIGCVGARPSAFKTVRYSEKLLEHAGISVDTLDLSEVYGRIERLADDDGDVLAKRAAIERYARVSNVPDHALVKMSKFGVVMDRWMADAQLDATAVQCWTSMEEYFGIVPCSVMSMLSNGLLPSACETDVVGTVSMLALALASGKPSALVDWNNNYGDDPDKGVVFHCSNLPKDVFVDDIPVMQYQEIIAGSVGAENTYGTLYGRVRETPFTYLRVSTDDLEGKIKAYVGEGEFTNDPLTTFGGYGVVRVPHLQELLQHICANGYEHHVSINQTRVAGAIYEAFTKYLGWATYHHR
ncbi:MAG TPA: L-fucose/L-arabinose isomerase family protein [Phototrophicaceae bacterium]|nr:L-fucose/L-arabinose isomerase family protein [Phototrophicaceae bacterium]